MKVIIGLLLAASVFYITPAFSEELTDEKRADIEELLEVSNSLALAQQMSEAFNMQMMAYLKRERPSVPAHVIEGLTEEINRVISENLPDFVEHVIPIYHKHFTAEEIKQMIEFHSTDLGKKIVRTMPMLMKESMEAGQAWGRGLESVMEERIRTRLAEEGYPL